MQISKEQLEYGFWFWDKSKEFPPENITLPSEYHGQNRVNIACTQLINYSSHEQKKLVNEWVEFLPTCPNLEFIWFTTHTPQRLFDSVCCLDNLLGLNIKWSSIKSLDKISKLKKLKYLRIGSSAGIESIKPLRQLNNLEVLELENLKRIRDFSIISTLSKLKFLSIEGDMYTKQKIDSFEPIGDLRNLIYLSAVMISCKEKRIDPLLKLKNLETLNWYFELSDTDIKRMKTDLHQLKYWPNRYRDSHKNVIKEVFGLV